MKGKTVVHLKMTIFLEGRAQKEGRREHSAERLGDMRMSQEKQLSSKISRGTHPMLHHCSIHGDKERRDVE